MFSKNLGAKLDKFHLLKHPFYQVYWNEGKLTREIIKDYAEQYYQHVKAFPRYISATHSICEDIEKRRILLENLQDEENKDGDHPKLWKNFAKALGANEKEIENVNELLELLEITQDEIPTKNDLKKAFLKKSTKLHPDKHPNEIDKYSKLFQEVNEAYKNLLNYYHGENNSHLYTL